MSMCFSILKTLLLDNYSEVELVKHWRVMSSYLRVRQDKRKTNWYEINEWQTDRKRKTDRDFGSAWPRADKTINRSNPPPAYSPESHWPGPPCITKQRDTMRQKLRDRETETEKDWQMEANRETRKAEESFWHWFFPFLSQLPSSTSYSSQTCHRCERSVWCQWANADAHVAYSKPTA